MAFTRQQWAIDFLKALGNPNPSQAVIDWVVGWTVHETATGGGARYNLLNTTERTSDSSFFNILSPGFGVQNYATYVEGVEENAHVLGEGFAGYNALKNALITNNISALQSSAVSQGLATWGTKSAAANPAALTALGAAHLDDTFAYGDAQPLAGGGGGGGGSGSGSGNQTASQQYQQCLEKCQKQQQLLQQALPAWVVKGMVEQCVSACLEPFGLNLLQNAFAVPCEPWDIGCIMQQILAAIAPLVKDALLVIIALVLIWVGVRLMLNESPQIKLEGLKGAAAS